MTGEATMIVDLIDPPGGAEFGFPKPLCDAEEADLDSWLIANGYPEDWVMSFPNGVPCRIVSCPADELWRFGIGEGLV